MGTLFESIDTLYGTITTAVVAGLPATTFDLTLDLQESADISKIPSPGGVCSLYILDPTYNPPRKKDRIHSWTGKTGMILNNCQRETGNALAIGDIIVSSPGNYEMELLESSLDIMSHTHEGIVAPTANDDDVGTGGNEPFIKGDQWLDTVTERIYFCVDNATGAAVWECTYNDCINTYYVGKYGDDTNDGKQPSKAFLTFGAAMAAASAGDLIRCPDGGTYVEDLDYTGKIALQIYAPSTTIQGSHTLIEGSDLIVERFLVPAGSTGATLNTGGSVRARIICRDFIMTGTGIGAAAVAGSLHVLANYIEVPNTGYGIGSSTSDEVFLKFDEMKVAAGGVGLAATGAGVINAECQGISGAGTAVLTVGGTPTINITAASVATTTVTNLAAGTDCSITAAKITGAMSAITKTISPERTTVTDTGFTIQDNGDATRQIAFEAGGITAGNTRTVTMPDYDINLGTMVSAPGYDAVVASTGGDYTSIASALSTEGAGKSILVKAGTYTETANCVIETGQTIHFEEKNGGVIIDFNGGAFGIHNASFVTQVRDSSTSATFAGGTAVITNLVGHDLSDVEANPSTYWVCYQGHWYQVFSADNVAKTITLVENVWNPVGAGLGKIFWVKNPDFNITMSGLLTVMGSTANGFSIHGLGNSDLSGLTIRHLEMPSRVYMLWSANANVGRHEIVDQDLETIGDNTCIGMSCCSSLTMEAYIKNITSNSGSPRFCVNLLPFVQGLRLTLDIAGGTNGGAGSLTGINGGSATETVVMGRVDRCDTDTASMGGCNVAVLM